MKRDQLLPEELYEFVRVISSANVELIKCQIEGWAYIKPEVIIRSSEARKIYTSYGFQMPTRP
jgi:hypothetical protein